jgi:hypothetical protein
LVALSLSRLNLFYLGFSFMETMFFLESLYYFVEWLGRAGWLEYFYFAVVLAVAVAAVELVVALVAVDLPAFDLLVAELQRIADLVGLAGLAAIEYFVLECFEIVVAGAVELIVGYTDFEVGSDKIVELVVVLVDYIVIDFLVLVVLVIDLIGYFGLEFVVFE